jgi:hypothetical protein
MFGFNIDGITYQTVSTGLELTFISKFDIVSIPAFGSNDSVLAAVAAVRTVNCGLL